MKSIYLLADSTPGVGMGHIKRCESIAKVLQGLDVNLCRFDSHKDVLPNIKNAVVVIDSHQDMSALVSTLKQQNTVICLDNFHSDQRDLSINVFNHATPIGKTYAGYPYMVIRDDVLARRGADSQIGDYAVLCIGGEDFQNMGIGIIEKMRPYFKRIIWIHGPNATMKAALKGVEQVHNPSHFLDLIQHAKIVCCNAGGIMFESVLMKKPTIVFPQSTYEANIADDFLKKNYIVSVGMDGLEHTLARLTSFVVPSLCFNGEGAFKIKTHLKEYL